MGSVINITSIWSSLLPMRLSKLDCPSCPSESQAMGLPWQILHSKKTFSKSICFFSVPYCYVARYLQPYIELNNTSGRPNQNWEQKFSSNPSPIPTPVSRTAFWRRLTANPFTYIVQSLQYSFPTAAAHCKQSLAHWTISAGCAVLQVFHWEFHSQAY